MAPSWQSIDTHWSWVAIVTGCAMEIGYLILVKRFQNTRDPAGDLSTTSAAQILWFTLGMAVYVLAFGSPLDYVSDRYLFSAHMVQHMAEVSVMVPLLFWGTPVWLVRRALAWAPLRRLLGWGTVPWVAVIGFDWTFDVFHLPVLYDLTLTDPAFHVLEHLLFFVGAVFLWWNVLSRLPEMPRLQPGKRLLYLFFAFDGMMPPAILILMWNHALYGPYAAAPRLLGLSPVSDQRLGSLIMMAVALTTFGAAAVTAFTAYDMTGWYE